MAVVSTSKGSSKNKKEDKRRQLVQALRGEKTLSKSHRRRVRRKENPRHRLMTTLDDLGEALEDIEESEPDGEDGGDPYDSDIPTETAVLAANKPKKKTEKKKPEQKLTAKKRQRVLEKESERIDLVLKNENYVANPFATIRLHTLNTRKNNVS